MSGPYGEHWLTDEERQEIEERAERRKKDNLRKNQPLRRKRKDRSEPDRTKHRRP